MDVEARIDELFGVPLEDFTQRRNELVKELSGAGEKKAASRVKAFKKPTTTVWAINQLAHRHGPELEELVRIHEQMAGVKKAGDLRGAAAERRKVVKRLTDLAARILVEAGHNASSTQTQRISQSLLAAASGTELDTLRWGRLTGELEGPGFEAMSGFADAVDSPVYERIDKRVQERIAKLERLAEESEQKATELERTAESAQDDADKAASVAKRARSQAEEARRKAEEAADKA
jgi:hypothetical protein